MNYFILIYMNYQYCYYINIFIIYYIIYCLYMFQFLEMKSLLNKDGDLLRFVFV